MEKLRQLFKGLRPFQKAEFGIMLALAFAIPFHWYAAQTGEVVLAVCAVLKFVFDQKYKVNPRQLRFSWAYIIFGLTWLVYLVGMLYTEEKSVGWAQVSKKLGFLVFALVFLISDMSYLTKERVRAIFYSLVTACLVFFAMNLIWSAFDIMLDEREEYRWFFNNGLMRLYYVHHTYMSMYALLALTFCFVDFFEQNNPRVKKFEMGAVIVLLLFIVLLDARAGILSLALEIVILWFWMTFAKKKIKIGLIAGLLVALISLPYVFTRMDTTLDKFKNKDNPDIRMVYIKGCSNVIENNLWFGVGTGDRSVETMASFENYRDRLLSQVKPYDGVKPYDYELCKDELINELFLSTRQGQWNVPDGVFFDFIKQQSAEYYCDAQSVMGMATQYIYVNNAIEHDVNAHNQYLDTMISVGLIGLLLLLAHFLIPMICCTGRKPFGIVSFSFLLIVMFNALFESIFEVQMGIVFFCFFNALLFTQAVINGKNKKNASTV